MVNKNSFIFILFFTRSEFKIKWLHITVYRNSNEFSDQKLPTASCLRQIIQNTPDLNWVSFNGVFVRLVLIQYFFFQFIFRLFSIFFSPGIQYEWEKDFYLFWLLHINPSFVYYHSTIYICVWIQRIPNTHNI